MKRKSEKGRERERNTDRARGGEGNKKKGGRHEERGDGDRLIWDRFGRIRSRNASEPVAPSTLLQGWERMAAIDTHRAHTHKH